MDLKPTGTLCTSNIYQRANFWLRQCNHAVYVDSVAYPQTSIICRNPPDTRYT
ncbi:hypothetical protein Mapa_006496 [Marchantia paleacea]|nr:hypothetical protein Mapa_006496 [Marchantia paleacea]